MPSTTKPDQQTLANQRAQQQQLLAQQQAAQQAAAQQALNASALGQQALNAPLPGQQVSPQQVAGQSPLNGPAAPPGLKPQTPVDSLENMTLSLAAVSLTLPTYWPLNPDAWFTKVEAQLKNARISNEETAFYKVLAVLPEAAAIKVREILQKAAFEAGDFARLKAKLVSVGQPTTLERLERLCELKQVAHKKPSEIVTDLDNIFHSANIEH